MLPFSPLRNLMSKLDLLQTHEAAEASAQGWALVDVFDTRSSRLAPQILPIHFNGPFKHARAATAWVATRARSNDPLALKALRIVVQGHKT